MEQLYNQKYKIIQELGSGGMGTVYRIYDFKLDIEWAMKKVKLQPCEKNEMLSLEAEICILKAVNNIHFPRIVDVFLEEDALFLVMDLVHGISLDRKIHMEGCLSSEQIASYGIQITEALSYLHSMQPPILYLDLKPSNIMLEINGMIKLVDFGSVYQFGKREIENPTNWRMAYRVCLSNDDEEEGYKISGTYGFASPEQLGQGEKETVMDARSDIYSLGATMFYLALKQKAGYGKKRVTSIRAYKPSHSEGLDKIISKCLRERPENRYQTMKELQHNLKNYKALEKHEILVKRIEQLILWILLVVSVLICQQAIEEIFQKKMIIFDRSLGKMLLSLGCCFLWNRSVVERRRLKAILYQQEKCILLTACENKKRISQKSTPYCYLVILSCLLWILIDAKPVNAVEKAENFQVIMRNEKWQKILLQKEHTYHTDKSLFLELDPDFFEAEKEYYIRISSTDSENGMTKQYTFCYQREKEQETR